MSRNLLLRIAFAVPAIGVAVLAVWRGGLLLAGALALLGVLGTREVYGFARRQGVAPLAGWGYGAAVVMPFIALWVAEADYLATGPAAVVAALWFLGMLAVAAIVRGPAGRPLAAVSVTVFGCLYAGALLTFIIPIRYGIHSEAHPLASTALVILPLAITWVCDTFAMAAGALFGGPKLAPVLSPHKTVAGGIGGVVGGLIVALVYGPLVLDRVALHLDVSQLVIVALVITVTAQTGDVVESLFKREVDVKDSSALIPGHGGVLDRLDSLYFVLPVSACLFWLLGLV
jgi:phosphatidate cytidylyltransferase